MEQIVGLVLEIIAKCAGGLEERGALGREVKAYGNEHSGFSAQSHPQDTWPFGSIPSVLGCGQSQATKWQDPHGLQEVTW